MGRTYLDLGEYAAARQHLERSLEIRRRELGAEHPDTVVTEVTLAIVPAPRSDRVRTEQRRIEAIELAGDVLGEDHPLTLHAMIRLAYVLSMQRDQPDKRDQARQDVCSGLGDKSSRSRRSSSGNAQVQLYLAMDYGDPKTFDRAVPMATMLTNGSAMTWATTTLPPFLPRAVWRSYTSGKASTPNPKRWIPPCLEMRRRVMGVTHPMMT